MLIRMSAVLCASYVTVSPILRLSVIRRPIDYALQPSGCLVVVVAPWQA